MKVVQEISLDSETLPIKAEVVLYASSSKRKRFGFRVVFGPPGALGTIKGRVDSHEAALAAIDKVVERLLYVTQRAVDAVIEARQG